MRPRWQEIEENPWLETQYFDFDKDNYRIQSKYTRFSHLIGGIVMLIIGVLLLFKPEFLMFG